MLRWLHDEGILTASQYDGAIHHAMRTRSRVEEAILEMGALSEAELLKVLAERYETRFVSTERLSTSKISRTVLQLIPHKLAERLQVFPILFESKRQTLSVVTAAPGENDAERQVTVVAGVRSVKPYVARPAAIAAAIDKFYRGNSRAFDELLKKEIEIPEYGSGLGGDVFGDVAPAPKAKRASPGAETDDDFSDPFAALMGPPELGDALGAKAPRRRDTAHPGTLKAAKRKPIPSDGMIPNDGVIPHSSSLGDGRSIPFEDHLEALNVFVSLLEQSRGQLRGHTAQVARLCRLVADRAKMSVDDRNALLVAAYLHDVGKVSGTYHLTALNVARYEGHQSQAKRTRLAPAKLFGAAGMPKESRRVLAHMYERFDGQGFPDKLRGDKIPYGSRVLAIVETYADLTANERNPYRRQLSQGQALTVLRELSGKLFDPALADLLVVLAADDTSDSSRPRALLVDPNPQESTLIELRLIEHGFVVEVVRDYAAATAQIAASPPQIVVTEIDLGTSGDGFELLEHVRAMEQTQRPSVIVFTERSDRDSVTRGFDLGAADYLIKPASAELVAAKASQALERSRESSGGGVRGSLREMSLPDVVQILSNGRRGGRLQLSGDGKRGEIHFKDGLIYDACFGKTKGADAFYQMLKLTDGSFQLDPSFEAKARVINTSVEGLLLEGMRRLDEGI